MQQQLQSANREASSPPHTHRQTRCTVVAVSWKQEATDRSWSHTAYRAPVIR